MFFFSGRDLFITPALASSDAGPPSQPMQNERGLVLASRKALDDAGVKPDQVDLVGTFACGLTDRDRIEAVAIQSVLGERAREVPALNVKGGLGNNGAGSGAIDIIATVLALHNTTIPPAINSEPIDPDCDIQLVTGQPVDAKIDVALSMAYALGGGQNAALVMRRYRE